MSNGLTTLCMDKDMLDKIDLDTNFLERQRKSSYLDSNS